MTKSIDPVRVLRHNQYSNWSLIQRLQERDPEKSQHRKGVDCIVSHDYMGSAEFEFGAVPATWKRFRAAAQAHELVRLETPFRSRLGTPFYVICHKDEDPTYIFQGILGASTRAYYTKESTYMDYWMDEKTRDDDYTQQTIAWITLNDWRGTSGYTENCPVFWATKAAIADRIFEELHKLPVKLGREPDSVYVFEQVKFEHHGRTLTGEIRGIYENHVQVLVNNERLIVEYTQLHAETQTPPQEEK